MGEFFQLFKTPWEFYRDDVPYAAVIVTGGEPPASLRAPLALIYGGDGLAWDEGNGAKPVRHGRSATLHHNHKNKKDRLRIYGACSFWPKTEGADLVDETDSAGAVWISRRERTVIRVGYDLLGEVRYLLGTGQPADMAAWPTLDRHIAYLREQLLNHGTGFVEIPPLPSGCRMVVCLTHDVDHPRIRGHRFDHTMLGFLFRAVIGSVLDLFGGRGSIGKLLTNWAAACRLPLVYLGVAADFWVTFDRYHALEADRRSTFFVIPYKNRPGLDRDGRVQPKRGAGYAPEEIADELERLVAAGREVALHGLEAWRDTQCGREEQARLQRFTRAGETGVRMHWLYFDEGSPSRLEAAGFSYDSTFGYNETVGFRAGTAQVFRPPGAKHLLELPLHIMDTALFYSSYLHLAPAAARQVVAQVVQAVEQSGGALVVNWHDRSLAPERLWDDFFCQLLEDLTRRGAWFPTAAAAVAWFRKRRDVVFHNVDWDNTGVRIKASAGGCGEALPALRLRVHPPGGRSRHEAAPMVETTFTDVLDARIAW